MKVEPWVPAAIAIVVALVAIERFYEHPTYGRGLSAALAVVQAGFAL